MSQKLQNFAKFQNFQLDNLVDFEKCCKTHIFLQKSEPIQPKTSNILPKFCQPTRRPGRAPEGCLLPASVAFWMRRWDCRGAAPPEAASLLTIFSQTSSGPFTVGSTPIFATVFVLLEIHMSYTNFFTEHHMYVNGSLNAK